LLPDKQGQFVISLILLWQENLEFYSITGKFKIEMNLFSFYNLRISQFHSKEKECIEKEKKLPFYRFFVLILGFILFWYLLKISILLSVVVLLSSLILFFVIVKEDNLNTERKKKFRQLIILNENEIRCIDGIYNFSDDGTRYKDESHPYSWDLDIFGNSSIFHLANRTTLPVSGDILSEWLLNPAGIDEIKERNEAVAELSKNIEWRQKVYVLGCSLENQENSLNNLISWVKKTDSYLLGKRYILLCSILSGITLVSLIFSFIFSVFYLPALLLCLHFFIIGKSNREVSRSHNAVTRSSGILGSYADIIRVTEKEEFKSVKLNKLREQLKSHNNFASQEIERLSGIVKNFDTRYNIMVHFFLNTLFFWDIHQVYKLEKWKDKNRNIEQWFHSVGEFESLSSFANLYFNNPDWCFPELSGSHLFFRAEKTGHPLINSRVRVCNDLTINGSGKILLLTGSNMSGKSTFLRAVGVNIILGMAGSCVCAAEFIISPVRILSSMRINDSLKDNTSSFLAELKKLESIIKAVERKEKVFLLLDELLRGTNSTDRHIGTTGLIKQLILNNAVGIIATHDLALTEMSIDYPDNIENYNFNIKINNEDLYFDYILNKGVCTSLNASILMKKMGINLD
jgi:hypothetical protein